MSFLDALPDEMVCNDCPTPHSICEATFCATCGPCPMGKERRAQLGRERDAFARGTFGARARQAR